MDTVLCYFYDNCKKNQVTISFLLLNSYSIKKSLTFSDIWSGFTKLDRILSLMLTNLQPPWKFLSNLNKFLSFLDDVKYTKTFHQAWFHKSLVSISMNLETLLVSILSLREFMLIVLKIIY